ncbi:MAG TPA: hypothetical protein VJG83_01160 [archaeon]|nr:hypothetical protein [archaeon]
MVDRQTRVKNKKFRRTPGGTTHTHYFRGDPSSAHCAITSKKLQGTGLQNRSTIRKQSKSARRPSVKFGGVLSAIARKTLWEYEALTQAGSDIHVPVQYRKFLSPKKDSKIEAQKKNETAGAIQ